VRQAQTKSMLSVNRELIALYWDIDRLAADVQKASPAIKGFSPRNIWRMRAFSWPIVIRPWN
jgi:hypothetical protein